jgi:Family of unknown function (DUF5681)
MDTNLEKGKPYRFKPGESGNPGGRPKKRPISDRYAELAELELPETGRIKHDLPEGATYGDALAIVMFKLALEGKTDAAREVREAIEGKTAHRQETIEPEKTRKTLDIPDMTDVYRKLGLRKPENDS